MTSFSGTVYPNGEFSVGIAQRKLSPSQVRPVVDSMSAEQADRVRMMNEHGLEPALAVCGSEAPLGLSSVPISHTRSKKGLKGISSYGRRMLRNGCFILEEAFGRQKCGFLTLTLPSMHLMDWVSVCANWGDIVRKFVQWMTRRLTARGVEPYLVYCTEFQTKRFYEESRAYPHLHACYPCRPRRSGDWHISSSEMRNQWREIVSRYVLSAYSFSASVDSVVVKKSVGAYLSKYLSKGTGDIPRYVEAGLHPECLGHWWGLAGGLRQAIQSRVRRSPAIARHLWRQATRYRRDGCVKWLTYVYVPFKDGGERCIGMCGLLDRTTHADILETYLFIPMMI